METKEYGWRQAERHKAQRSRPHLRRFRIGKWSFAELREMAGWSAKATTQE